MRSQPQTKRALGALAFVDVTTGRLITDGLSVRAVTHELRMSTNRSGLFVIRHLDDALWRAYMGQFEHVFDGTLPSANTSLPNVRFEVIDTRRRYVPRAVEVTLPRLKNDGSSETEALEVSMYPTPQGVMATNWSPVRAYIQDSAQRALGNVFVRVVRIDDGSNAIIGEGISVASFDPLRPDVAQHTAGEVLVRVLGVPITSWSGASVLNPNINVDVQFFVPSDADIRRGEVLLNPSLPNTTPDHIIQNQPMTTGRLLWLDRVTV